MKSLKDCDSLHDDFGDLEVDLVSVFEDRETLDEANTHEVEPREDRGVREPRSGASWAFKEVLLLYEAIDVPVLGYLVLHVFKALFIRFDEGLLESVEISLSLQTELNLFLHQQLGDKHGLHVE